MRQGLLLRFVSWDGVHSEYFDVIVGASANGHSIDGIIRCVGLFEIDDALGTSGEFEGS